MEKEDDVESKTDVKTEKKTTTKTENSDIDMKYDSNLTENNSSSEGKTKDSIKLTPNISDKEDYDLIVESLKDVVTPLREAIFSIGKRAQEIKDRAEETFTVGAKRDAREIQALGGYVENVIKSYEDTMVEINKRNYADQKKLLKGYKKLLEEQINMINARIELVKRLKSSKH